MKVIDLTQTITPNMSIFPFSKPPVFHTLATCQEEGYAELELTLNSHQGTHMDAPAHVHPDGLTLDQFPPNHFIGQGIVIDCTSLNSKEIQPVDLLEKSCNLDFVLFYTGWGEKWNTEEYLEQPPTISNALATQLIKTGIKGIGIDAFSIEDINSLSLPIHKQLMQHNIVIIENLTNLDHLVGQAFTLVCLPLKVEHADGSPSRVIAICS